MMKKYTTVFIDLDETLLDFKAAEKSAVKKVLCRHNLPHSEEDIKDYSLINKGFWERFERGEIPKSDIFEGRFRAFLEKHNAVGDTAKIAKDYSAALADEHQTIPFAHEILRLLRERGYNLFATTNGLSSTQFKRVHESGLYELFDDVFVSEQAGHQKPEKEYFDYVIANSPEKDRSKILVIGDSESSDILGALNSGLDICWYNPDGKETDLTVNYEVKCLEEIDNILR